MKNETATTRDVRVVLKSTSHGLAGLPLPYALGFLVKDWRLSHRGRVLLIGGVRLLITVTRSLGRTDSVVVYKKK